jgi:hypothetical protein
MTGILQTDNAPPERAARRQSGMWRLLYMICSRSQYVLKNFWVLAPFHPLWSVLKSRVAPFVTCIGLFGRNPLARLARWGDYVGKNHWRFGFALAALVAVEAALISAALLFRAHPPRFIESVGACPNPFGSNLSLARHVKYDNFHIGRMLCRTGFCSPLARWRCSPPSVWFA